MSIQQVKNGFEISNHRFLNRIASGIITKIAQTVPGLNLNYAGKNVSDKTISATLVGQVTLESKEDLEEATSKVNQVMQNLKNPADLLSIIGRE